MPGTIHVSVLDLLGLPSSSMSVKVSIGKREYQIWDKGDFSFPLTTLRDNLIVTLLDPEGNELSRTGVKTMSIVEKGLWDDLFPLEGGGHLHMKLQFNLSEEERKQIQEMRESALKKKHGELLSGSIRQLGTAAMATVGGNISSPSLPLNHEVTDLQESLVQIEDVSVAGASLQGHLISNPISQDKGPQSGPGNREGSSLDRLAQTAPNATDEREGTSSMLPLSQELTILHLTEENQKVLKKTGIQSTPINFPPRSIPSKEALDPQLGCSESLVAKKTHLSSSKLEEDQIHSAEKQSTLEKTPSNVRKMISAFESSLSQGPGPRVNTSTWESQASMIEIGGSVKEPRVQDAKVGRRKTTHQIAETELNLFSIGKPMDVNLHQSPKYIISRRDQIDLVAQNVSGATDRMPKSQNIRQLEVSGARQTVVKGANSNESFNLKLPCKKENTNYQGIFLEELTGPSVAETAMGSRRMLDDTYQSCNVPNDQHDSIFIAPKKNECRTNIEDSDKLSVCGPSSEKLQSIAYHGVEQYPFEEFGSWIFPDEMKRLCITTGSKQVIDLVGGCGSIGEENQGKINMSRRESLKEQNEHNDTCVKMDKNEKLGSSTDVRDSGGLLRQAVRVAIMVAFGTLVLFTRERKNR